jgi:hypothetical protein
MVHDLYRIDDNKGKGIKQRTWKRGDINGQNKN